MSNNVSIERVIRQFSPSAASSSTQHAVILLNGSTQLNENYINLLLQNAAWFAAVDGVANWVCNRRLVYKNAAGLPLPDVVSGDFDSIDDETLAYFKQYPSVRVIRTADQDKTDLVKCMEILALDKEANDKFQSVIVVPSLHGRVDHIFGNINALFVAKDLFPDKPVFLLSGKADREQSICLLGKGHTRIDLPSSVSSSNSCGLIPINGRCESVSTQGLVWDVSKTPMSFGGLVSTSNRLKEDSSSVQVETDNDLLWVLELGAF